MNRSEISEFAAIRISKENIKSLAYFNGGVTPDRDAIGEVFLYPLDPDSEPAIIDVVDFFEDYEITEQMKLNHEFAVNCFYRK